MADIKILTNKHPALAYFILTLFISWGCILAVIGIKAFFGIEKIPENVLPLVYLATLAGPSAASIILIGFIDGKAGFRELGARLIKWRVGLGWYAVSLLTAPLLITLTLLGLYLTSPEFLPAIISAENKIGLILTGTMMGLMVGLFEEVGWTGVCVPKLLNGRSILATGLIVGIVWGVWHFPLFSGSRNSSGAFPQLLYVAVLLFSFLPPYRILMVWLYKRTGSLLLTILMHAPLAASQLILIPSDISGVSVVVFDVVFSILLWIFVFFLLRVTKKPDE